MWSSFSRLFPLQFAFPGPGLGNIRKYRGGQREVRLLWNVNASRYLIMLMRGESTLVDNFRGRHFDDSKVGMHFLGASSSCPGGNNPGLAAVEQE